MSDSPRLPRRVAWFAPWTWRPWTRWAIGVVLLVGYVLLPMPVEYIRVRCGVDRYPLLDWLVKMGTLPIRQAIKRPGAVQDFYAAHWFWLNDTFGPAYPTQYD